MAKEETNMKVSNCKKCFYHEIFESKVIKKTIHYCHSKGHQIYMVHGILACPEWGFHHGKEIEL